MEKKMNSDGPAPSACGAPTDASPTVLPRAASGACPVEGGAGACLPVEGAQAEAGEKILTLQAEVDGERVDVFLSGALPELSRSAVQRLLENGNVTCRGLPLRKNARTQAGARYTVTLPPVRETALVAQDIPLEIVYEDEDVLVINKPKGLVVHPAAGHEDGTLVNALLHHCAGSLSGIGGEKRPGIVHRIDMDTTGLLIVAKNDAAHQALSAQLKDHTLCRTYECIVRGGFREDSGTVNAPIGRDPLDRKRMAVTEKNSREAVTHWEVLRRYGQYTHLRCRLETGRTHQIRVHMAYLRHPIAGDPLYGGKKPELGLHSQCLHARELTFIHPRTGETMTFTCALPEEFQAALRRLQAEEER